MVIYFGWNASTSNNIEAHMVMGHINNLRAFIPSEDIEYLNSIDFNNPDIQISESLAQRISDIIKSAEQARESNIRNNTPQGLDR